MSREQKLALIVGFALVLVVGILISDHLSPASTDEPLEELSFKLPLGEREFPPAVVTDRTVNEPAADSLHVAAPPPEDTETAVRDEPTGSPVLGFVPVSSPDAQSDSFEPIEITQGTGDLASARPKGGLYQLPPPATPVRQANTLPAPPRVGPGFANYVVQKDETLSEIAAHYLGSAAKWKELAKLNPDRVGKNGSVQAGTTLRLPAGAVTHDTTPAKAPETKLRTYLVRPKDTLSQIAQRELGTSKRVDDILKLNKDKINDADEIYVGLALRLPAR